MHIPVNPFQDTKASFYDIPQIIDNWVDIGSNKFIDSVMIPTSSTPIRIFGGKGTGKTHILRFFSFQSQQLRAQKYGDGNILKQIQSDGYIGIYIEANGLEVNRFSGCGYSDEEWRNTFYYFFNLELIERLLKKLTIIFHPQKDISTEKVAEYFYNEETVMSFSTLDELYKYIRKERKSIDSQVANLSTPGNTNSFEITPLFRIENAFKDIVKTILDSIEEMNGIRILYIIDEIENFSIEQQKYINSLVRHIGGVHNISLRLAGRLYGKKTDDTLDADQKLLEDAEIKTIYLEDTLKPNFPEFAQALYKKRIEVVYGTDIEVDFSKTFESRNLCDKEQLLSIMKKHAGKERPHIKKLSDALEKYKKYSNEQIKSIIYNLIYEEDWLVEKINIYLLYKEWDGDLLKSSERIKTSCRNYIDGKQPNLHKDAYEKHELDLRYQLYRSYSRNVSYAGYSDIVKMSNNNPRIFLSMLDNIFKVCTFNKVDLLKASTVSCKLQDKALLESSNWFWNNFTTEVKDAKVLRAFNALCEFFRAYRRSDKPGEKYAVIFSYNESDIDENVKQLIEMAVDNSLLIRLNDRKDRNSSKFLKNLRIHPMMAPKWELPLGGGGTITLNHSILHKLFLNDKDSELEQCFKEILQLVDIPFKKRTDENKKAIQAVVEAAANITETIKKPIQKSLFED